MAHVLYKTEIICACADFPRRYCEQKYGVLILLFVVVDENYELQIWNIILGLCTFYKLLLRQMICRKLQRVFFLITCRKNKFIRYLSGNRSLIQSQIFQCSLEQKWEVIQIPIFLYRDCGSHEKKFFGDSYLLKLLARSLYRSR